MKTQPAIPPLLRIAHPVVPPGSRLRIPVREVPGGEDRPDTFPVPLTRVRRVIVESYVHGIFDAASIAARLEQELRTPAAARPVRVDARLIRDVQRQDEARIESDLAGTLSRDGRLGVMPGLFAARERLRLARWVIRALGHPPR
jgi:hypothetical protein